jgi:hypothetical protein
MKTLGRAFLGAVVIALGTWFFGWTVPVWWGVIAGLVWAGDQAVVVAALSGAVGWGAILCFELVLGYPIGTLGVRLAGAMQIPLSVLLAATLIFPAVLAGSAAGVATAIRQPKSVPAVR